MLIHDSLQILRKTRLENFKKLPFIGIKKDDQDKRREIIFKITYL